ncbi:uncharacterized protein LOC126831682 isoform X3 [Patella vulgata]|uniref:uncharacterized protein LOC126831682 isoform X3 n=1 Tax=Patella vulgata TaxID=6465 RepID=UPI0024A8852D|nr:uncharacterized protein LOC126831682 isoform X3 [Patella vulgata]
MIGYKMAARKFSVVLHKGPAEVRCGSVYVTSDDTAQQVTNNILSATCLAEKKKRGHKFTVAVGTTHGHVQAFLADTDNVLSALDTCKVDEKCLMLIKRPKNSSKQMLKAHSWANLSVSDSHLNRPLDLGFNTNKHSKHKWRRRTDQQSVMSEGDIMTNMREGFNKENIHQRYNRHGPRAVVPPMVNGTNSLDRQVMSHPDFSKCQEINNNKLSSNRDVYMYHSCLDISTMPTVHETETEQNGRLQSDELYARPEVDPNTEVDVSRAQSLGDLTQGLSLSVAQDRKSGSMMNLSNVPPPRARRRNRTPGGSHHERYNTLEVFQEIPEHYTQKMNLTSSSDYNYSASRHTPADIPREQSPLKQKRSLPQVPTVEANERIKRFTEMMKSRMSAHSSNGYRTNSQNSSYSEHGRSLSYTGDTPSDNEVFELLQTVPIKSSPQSFKNIKCNSSLNKERDSGIKINYTEKCNTINQSQNGHPQTTPLPSGDRSSDSGQITLLSHCSTIDSGYTTNNDCEYEYGQNCKSNSHNRVQQNVHGQYPNYSTPQKSYGNYATVKSPKHRQPIINGYQKNEVTEKPKTPTTPRNVKIETLPNHHRWNDVKNSPHQRRSWDTSMALDNSNCHVTKVTENNHPVMNGYPIPDSEINGNSTRHGFVSNTLPGHWKYPTSPISQISPPIGSPTAKHPTMYQLSQSYDFYPIRISLPSVALLMESVELKDTLIDLPENRDSLDNSSFPQGRYARIGGPGSAFRPVRPASITPAMGRMVVMTKLTEDILRACIMGELKEGDVMVEINGQPLLGADVRVVKKNLEVCQGDITLTIARKKLPIQSMTEKNSYDSLSNKVMLLEKEMRVLRVEMKNKDLKIEQLTDMLPEPPRCNSSPIREHEEIGLPNFDNIVISDDEFIV